MNLKQKIRLRIDLTKKIKNLGAYLRLNLIWNRKLKIDKKFQNFAIENVQLKISNGFKLEKKLIEMNFHTKLSISKS